MPTWKTEPVAVQPTLTLRLWSVKELPGGDRHLVGYCRENAEGRVSSRVVTFDPAQGIVETISGRVYRLCGRPGIDMDALYVWDAWCRMNHVDRARDVTEEVAEAMASASPGGAQ